MKLLLISKISTCALLDRTDTTLVLSNQLNIKIPFPTAISAHVGATIYIKKLFIYTQS